MITRALEAENFLGLVAEDEVRETGRMRQTQCTVADLSTPSEERSGQPLGAQSSH